MRIHGGLAAVFALGAMVGCAGVDEGFESFDDHDKADGLGQRSDGPKARYRNQTEFVSALPFYNVWGPLLRTATDTTESVNKEREIVESDIYKLDGRYLYTLSQYRGLQITDVGNPDKPVRMGRVEIWGRPFEMYVRGTRAYVLVSDYFRADGDKSFRGSRLVTVDLTVKSKPRVIGGLDVTGYLSNSRLVGDVLYAVTSAWETNQTHVISFDLRASKPVEVERVSFEGSSYQIAVTQDYLFVAQYGYPNTQFQVVGISDPRGHIVKGARFELQGNLQDRHQMDFRAGYLRVVLQHWATQGNILIRTVRVDSATQATVEGSLDLNGVGQLLATKFDGDKGYLVHIQRVDPLDVIDFSDAAHPVRKSSLEIPGWLEHLEIRGNRVLGIGVDSVTGPRNLAVALYDVTDPTATREMARATIPASNWAWTSGFADDRAFKMLDDKGLLLVPVSSWTENKSEQVVQLVDFNLAAGTLATRGRVEQAGDAQRSFPVQSRIAAFSERELRVANIDDRDHPTVTGSLELARNVLAFTKLGTAGVQLVGEYDTGYELRAVSLGDADAPKEAVLSTLVIGKDATKLYAFGNLVVVEQRSWTEDGKQWLILAAFDYSRPSSPRSRGVFKMELDGSAPFRGIWWRPFNISDVLQVRPELFVIANLNGEGRKLTAVSFADADKPVITHERKLSDDKAQYSDVRALGGALYATHYVVTEDGQPLPEEPPVFLEGNAVESRIAFPRPVSAQFGKYYVTRYTVSSRGALSASKDVNIPGRFIDVDASGNLITLDQRWENDGGKEHQHKHLTKLTVDFGRGVARLRDLLNLDDGVSDVMVRDGFAYYTNFGGWSGPILLEGDSAPANKWTLNIVDVKAARLREASHTVVQSDGSGSLLDVRAVGTKKLAFLSLGYGGLAVWDVTRSSSPSQALFVPASAWYNEVLVDAKNAVAHAWSGYFGVRTLSLPQ